MQAGRLYIDSNIILCVNIVVGYVVLSVVIVAVACFVLWF